LVGRSPYLQPVHATTPPDMMGTVASVTIESAQPNSLRGRVLSAGVRSAAVRAIDRAGADLGEVRA
jgi:tRNA-2-methylthio-N6-dimethylallyladenosine synthase